MPCFWKLAVVDQRDGFFLDGSSGPTGASSTGRPTRDGSLLRRTWRGMSVVHRGCEKKKKRGVEFTRGSHRQGAPLKFISSTKLLAGNMGCGERSVASIKGPVVTKWELRFL